MLRIAVFVSEKGSNLQAIIGSINKQELNVSIEAVVSDKFDCGAFQIANKNNISTFTVSGKISENSVKRN